MIIGLDIFLLNSKIKKIKKISNLEGNLKFMSNNIIRGGRRY